MMAIGVIGCDYSTKEIWLARVTAPIGTLAAWENVAIKTKKEDRPFYEVLQDIYRTLTDLSAYQQARVVYIEKPWGSYNIKTALALARVAAVVEVEACRIGLEVKWAHPSTWRKNIFGKGTRISREVRKLQAVQFVEDRWGKKIGHDEAEAALIALYGWRLENEAI